MPADYVTIRCALTANRETRKYLWELMQSYTLLMNDLLEQVPQQPEFNQWRQQGHIPDGKAIKPLLDALKQQPAYAHLPGRFHDSAKRLTAEIYASWLALHRKRLAQILGKQRWMRVVETELKLAKTHPFTHDKIRKAAQQALTAAKKKQVNRQAGASSSRLERELLGILLKMHEGTKSILRKRAINHLLLHSLQINTEELNLQRPQERLEAKTIEAQRLETQIQSQLPKGRDPNGQRYRQAVLDVIAFPSQSDLDKDDGSISGSLTQQKQIPLLSGLPYPVSYSGSGEFYWKQEHDKICVSFKGLLGHSFKVNCGHRQLPVFRQFVDDYQTNRSRTSEDMFSGTLFTLRSAQLLWLPDPRLKYRNKVNRKKGKAEYNQPWETHRLYLHCSLDRRALTAEGTAEIQQQEQTATQRILGNAQQSKALSPLSPTQAQHIKRKLTQLKRLQDNTPPSRPSQPIYQGDAQRVMGLSFGRHDPVTVAVANTASAQVLETLSTRAVLNRGPQKKLWRNGKLNPTGQDEFKKCHPNQGQLNTRLPGSQTKVRLHRLVNRLHQQHQADRLRRAKAQQQDCYFRRSSVSDLSLYTNRLIAKKLIQLACDRQVSTIVMPKLEGIRESVESDIQAQAIRRYPNDKNRQKYYRKQYRASFHAWSYQELASCIQACARKQGIRVMIHRQQLAGSLTEKAAQMALSEQSKAAA